MPGAYAHLSVVNDAQKRAEAAGRRNDTLACLGLNLKFLELGSVSPDYPYLSLRPDQKCWADNMHYNRTATLLRSGVLAVRKAPPESRGKATAWLLGFAAHMAMDMTIHPVVEIRVGPYAQNKGEHRRCEMHQDAFIFPRVMDVGDTGLSEHLATGIATCHAASDRKQLDPGVEQVWRAMLTAAYPNDLVKTPPIPDSWQAGFIGILTSMAGANHLFPWARHVSADLNLAYPAVSDIDSTFIRQLRTPEGLMDYVDVYARARVNVLSVWKGIDDALESDRSDFLDGLEDWNLDSGRTVQSGRLVFWKEAT